MATTYTEAPKQVLERLAEMMRKHHGALKDADVWIGVIVAVGDGETPPVKGYGGMPAAAKVKVVPLRDRLKKKYDAELLLSADFLDGASDKLLDAVLDHELTHLELKLDDEKAVKRDDLGRPKLKVRPEDFGVWGFWDVVQRHGDCAQEVKGFRRIGAEAAEKKLAM